MVISLEIDYLGPLNDEVDDNNCNDGNDDDDDNDYNDDNIDDDKYDDSLTASPIHPSCQAG